MERINHVPPTSGFQNRCHSQYEKCRLAGWKQHMVKRLVPEPWAPARHPAPTRTQSLFFLQLETRTARECKELFQR